MEFFGFTLFGSLADGALLAVAAGIFIVGLMLPSRAATGSLTPHPGLLRPSVSRSSLSVQPLFPLQPHFPSCSFP